MQVTDSKTRFYIDDLPADFLPGLTHFGAMHNRQAIPALDDHVHSGAMEICYVHSGTASFEVANQSFHLSGGDIFLTFPDEPHSTGHSALGLMTLYWLGVKLDQDGIFGYAPEEAEPILQALRNIRSRVFRGNTRLKDLMEDAVNLIKTPSRFTLTLLRSRLTDFLLEVVAAEQRHRQAMISPPIQRVVDYLQSHPTALIPVERMAKLAGLSVPRFHTRFKNETGFPPKQWQMEQRIKLAETRLAQGQPVTKVAIDLGFPSSQHFATMFRIYRGTSPSHYYQA